MSSDLLGARVLGRRDHTRLANSRPRQKIAGPRPSRATQPVTANEATPSQPQLEAPRSLITIFVPGRAARQHDEDSLALLRHRGTGPRPGGRGPRDHHASGERPALRAGERTPPPRSTERFSSLLPRPSDTATQLPRPRSHPPPPPSQVLQHHFPGRELHRDVADVSDLPPETELLAAGFPCPVRAASSPEPRRPVRRPRRWRAVPDARRPR